LKSIDTKRFSRIPALMVLLLTIPGAMGCGPAFDHYKTLDSLQVNQRFSEADTVIKKHQRGYGRRNSVLYDLDRGMMLHLAGDYAESNKYLFKAEEETENLYTQSVSTGLGAMVTNDNTFPYEGEDFEKVMINIIAGMNYIFMDQSDEALVEARKVDHKLNFMNDQYEKKNIYKRDGLARYVSGILYEAKGMLNDAFISYRMALEAYEDYRRDYGTPIPLTLPSDLLRTAQALGLEEEHSHYREQFPNAAWMTEEELGSRSEVIFLGLIGRSPIKEDYFIDAPIPDGEGGAYLGRIAVPKYVALGTEIKSAKVYLIPSQGGVMEPADLDRAISQDTFLMENITAISMKNLEDRMDRIKARAVARAIIKYEAVHSIKKVMDINKQKSAGEQVAEIIIDGILTKVIPVISEEADKRSWHTFPGEIWMARVVAPPGEYTIVVDYHDRMGRSVSRKTYPPLTLPAGEKKLLSDRVLGHPD
jgi:hypothetical protein